ncbi:MAG: hypothetical protein JWP01_2150 [Myxococcales bacterium]|nr:hypothetical protein [Myxococcales bacterium]
MLRSLLPTVALGLSLGLSGASCTSGPPPGFAGGTGDRWSFPLVGALEDDLLITPVTIDGRGPFLFALDPDANISIVDEQLVKDVGLRTRKGPRRLDETDTQHPRFYAEVLALEIGNLIVERRDAMVVKTGTFDTIGRRIYGVLGKDVLADSLVFGFDRDQGLGYLTTVKAFKPPADAIAVPYQLVRSMISNAEVPPLGRRLAAATIGGETFSMHLDLGAQVSQLREKAWERAKLVPRDGTASLIDEVGTRRGVAKLGLAETVTLGTASAAKVAFVPYDDKRWNDQELDGTLGLDFFRAYSVWIHWDAKTYYLARRRTVAPATRADRWDVGALGRCKQLGCVSARLVDPVAGKPADPTKAHPGVVLAVTREELAGGMELEIVFEAKDRPELPRLVVNMAPTADRVMQHLKPEWVGVTLIVVDASPFPRACPAGDGCVDLLAR